MVLSCTRRGAVALVCGVALFTLKGGVPTSSRLVFCVSMPSWRMCVALLIASGSFFLGQHESMPAWMRGSTAIVCAGLRAAAVMATCYGALGSTTNVARVRMRQREHVRAATRQRWIAKTLIKLGFGLQENPDRPDRFLPARRAHLPSNRLSTPQPAAPSACLPGPVTIPGRRLIEPLRL